MEATDARKLSVHVTQLQKTTVAAVHVLFSSMDAWMSIMRQCEVSALRLNCNTRQQVQRELALPKRTALPFLQAQALHHVEAR
jgi:hypothetical protein